MVPVIAVDGPSGAGKGTISAMLARALQFHLLDSGALYRLLAFVAQQRSIKLEDEQSVADLTKNLDVEFCVQEHAECCRVLLNGHDVSLDIRGEDYGENASKIAASPVVTVWVESKELLSISLQASKNVPADAISS